MHIGTAYYPEHWPRERWAEDLALMREAGLSQIRIAEFAWCRIEPHENEWSWQWLDDIIALADAADIKVLLCTPTQAPPPWLSHNYPETRPHLADRQPIDQGGRRHVDAASPAFRYFAERVTRKMGERYGQDRRVVGWQLDNEIGAHTHFFSTSQAATVAFRNWLRRKYNGDIDALNADWGTVFWSGEFREWSEIEVVVRTGAGPNPAIRKNLRSFGEWLWRDFLAAQAAILKPLCPGQFVTHNVAWFGEQLDLWALNEFCDVVGLDNYRIASQVVTGASDLYRAAAGDAEWAILETNGQNVQWQDGGESGPGNGSLASSLARYAIAGAKFTSLFRFQTSPCGAEQNHHSGLRDPWGRPDTETITGCQQGLAMIDSLQDFLQRPRRERVGIVFDTDNLIFHEMQPVEGRGRINFMNSYCFEALQVQQAFHRCGLRAGFTRFGADWSQFDCVVLWNNLLAELEDAEQLRAYVSAGGCVVANNFYGTQNRSGRRQAQSLPLGATEIFGCRIERELKLRDGKGPRLQIAGQQPMAVSHGMAVESLGADVLATWLGWHGPEQAAMLGHRYGEGRAVFVGACVDGDGVQDLISEACRYAELQAPQPISPAAGVEVFPERDGWVVASNTHEERTLQLDGRFQNLIDGSTVQGALQLAPYGLAVLVD